MFDESAIGIIVAAGSGTRMGTDIKKQYLNLNDKPILIYTLEIMELQDLIAGVVLVVPGDDLDYCAKLVKKHSLQKVIKIVPGGKTRGESVFRGLQGVPNKTKFVVVHDGARPFLSQSVLKSAIQTGIKESAAIVAVPVKDTIKEVNTKGIVQKTLERSSLWSVQTPQVFSKELLEKYYLKAFKDGVDGTDDASILEAYGLPIKIVMGDYKNIKITTQEDIEYGEFLLQKGD